VIVLLILVVPIYFLILLGLIIWFEKYHYYKNTYFNNQSLKPDDLENDSSELNQIFKP